MDAAPRPLRPGVGVGVLAVTAALLAWALCFGGASGSGATARLGTAAAIAAAALVVAWAFGLLALPRLDRAGTVAAAAAVGLVAWTGITISWSIAGDLSWAALSKGLVLLAFGVVGLAAVALPGRPVRSLALLLAVLLGLLLAWSLAGKAVPSLGPDDADRVARLKGPVGYWNALSLLADAALALALWLLVSVRARLARPGGALLLFAATVALLLTQSRAGVLAAVAVVAFALALSEEPVAAALNGLLAGAPGIAVVAWALTRPALVEDGAARADRVSDGSVLGVLLLLGAAAALLLVSLVPVQRLASTRRRTVVRALAGAAAALAVVGLAGLVITVGNPVSWARDQLGGSGEVTNDPSRLGSLETNNRTVWWGEAWQIFRAHPAGGTGAGTFEIARKRVRDDARTVKEPHSVPLQLLSEAGLPALVLGIALVAAVGLAIRAALRRLEPGERLAAVALTGLPLAFGLHALVDYDLDFLAVAAPTALVSAALLGAGRPAAAARSRVLVPAAAVLVAAAAIWVLAAPAFSSRLVERAYRQADAGDLTAAASSAKRAQQLDPLSLDPLYARSDVAQRAGDKAAAERFLEQATELQPENPDPWYQLGLFRQLALGDQCGAYYALNAAYTLDPRSSLFPPGGALDVARDAVNDRENPACGK